MAKNPDKFCGELKARNATPSEIRNIYTSFIKSIKSNTVDTHILKSAKEKSEAMKLHFKDILYNGENDQKALEPPKPVPFEEQIAKKYIQLSTSASKRGKDFNLTLKDIEELLEVKTCFYTGVMLNSLHKDNYQRTIDRVDNNKGYVKGNVVACSHLSNQIKNELFENPTSDILTNINFISKLIVKMHKTLKENK